MQGEEQKQEEEQKGEKYRPLGPNGKDKSKEEDI